MLHQRIYQVTQHSYVKVIPFLFLLCILISSVKAIPLFVRNNYGGSIVSSTSGGNGTPGTNGLNGNSTNITVINNNNGTYIWEFFYSGGFNYANFTTSNLTGTKGDTGSPGSPGSPGSNGANGVAGTNGTNAYNITNNITMINNFTQNESDPFWSANMSGMLSNDTSSINYCVNLNTSTINALNQNSSLFNKNIQTINGSMVTLSGNNLFTGTILLNQFTGFDGNTTTFNNSNNVWNSTDNWVFNKGIVNFTSTVNVTGTLDSVVDRLQTANIVALNATINWTNTNITVVNPSNGSFIWKFFYNGVNIANFTTQNLTGTAGTAGYNYNLTNVTVFNPNNGSLILMFWTNSNYQYLNFTTQNLTGNPGTNPNAPIGNFTTLEQEFLCVTNACLPPFTGSPLTSGTTGTTLGDTTDIQINHPGIMFIKAAAASGSGYLFYTASTIMLNGSESATFIFRPFNLTNGNNQTQIDMGFGNRFNTDAGKVTSGPYIHLENNTLIGIIAISTSSIKNTTTNMTWYNNTWYKAVITIVNSSIVNFTVYNSSSTHNLLWNETLIGQIDRVNPLPLGFRAFVNGNSGTAKLVDFDYLNLIIPYQLYR